MAVPESLQKLLEEGVIDEIQRRLMSGKEASVYVVTHRGKTVAAKVYKARDRRSFKATSSYTEGRNQTRNTRDKRAMDRRSSYGKELMEDSWRDMEYRALTDAHYAGVRVPKAIMIYEDVLLMELLVDAEGEPAPRLADFDLDAEQANEMFREIYRQVRLFLTAGRIHGDLSAFNILMAADGPTIIDLPQVVDAAGNSQARQILGRDLRNVVEHLARFDERLLRFVECGDPLFHHYQRGTLEEAIEPREVRRVHTGGRRVSGQERAEGQVGQQRRGGPQRGPQHGGPRGQQHGAQRGGPPAQSDRGQHAQPRTDRGPQQGAQRGGPPAQSHRGQQAQPRGGAPRRDLASPRDERARNAQPNDVRREPRSGDPRQAQRPSERHGDPRQAQRPSERNGDPRQAQRPNERNGDPRQAQRPNERNGDPRGHDPRDAQRRQDTSAPRRDPRAPQRSETQRTGPQRSEPQRSAPQRGEPPRNERGEPRRDEGPPGVTVERRRRR